MADSKHDRRFQWWADIWIPLIGIIITALLSIIGTWWYAEWSNRLRTLQYYTVSSPAIIKKPELRNRDLKISLDGQPLDNLSVLTVYLYNDTDQDFDDVPMDVVLKPVKETGKVPNLLQAVPSLPSEAFATTKLADDPDGSNGFSYLLHVVNRSKHPVIQLDYVFEGSVCPDVAVAVRKKGVTTAFIDPRQLNNSAQTSGGMLFGTIFAAVLFTLFWLTSGWRFLKLPEKLEKLRKMRAPEDPTARVLFAQKLAEISTTEKQLAVLAEEAVDIKRKAEA